MTHEFCKLIFPPSQAGCAVILDVIYNQIASVDWFFKPVNFQTRMEAYPENTLFDCIVHYLYYINPEVHDVNKGSVELCQQHSIWDATLLTPLATHLISSNQIRIIKNEVNGRRTYTSLMKSEFMSTALRIQEFDLLTMTEEEVGIALHRVFYAQKAIRDLAINWLLLYCHRQPTVPAGIREIVAQFKKYDFDFLKGSATENKEVVLKSWPVSLLEPFGCWEYAHREPDVCSNEEWQKENLLPFTIIIKKLDFAILQEPTTFKMENI